MIEDISFLCKKIVFSKNAYFFIFVSSILNLGFVMLHATNDNVECRMRGNL
jgi:hypothetical protein